MSASQPEYLSSMYRVFSREHDSCTPYKKEGLADPRPHRVCCEGDCHLCSAPLRSAPSCFKKTILCRHPPAIASFTHSSVISHHAHSHTKITVIQLGPHTRLLPYALTIVPRRARRSPSARSPQTPTSLRSTPPARQRGFLRRFLDPYHHFFPPPSGSFRLQSSQARPPIPFSPRHSPANFVSQRSLELVRSRISSSLLLARLPLPIFPASIACRPSSRSSRRVRGPRRPHRSSSPHRHRTRPAL